MSWFCKHDWKEIARTVAKPPPLTHIKNLDPDTFKVTTMGQTTILWECQKENCQKIRKEEMLGLEVSGER